MINYFISYSCTFGNFFPWFFSVGKITIYNQQFLLLHQKLELRIFHQHFITCFTLQYYPRELRDLTQGREKEL